ncbi:hypothetical protein RHGRI_005598 [Rhododendron griersonianum]|uniref:Uncharacterized protein n=1 Tax=Rhododendron griersonianum TaxID=479676 RepID=A0AAV6LD67_9ERIC|nr:hypothetical protein RHGRI_005598 [Rhododendron griersonianum]
MVGLSVSLFLVLSILFCLISRSPSETDAFGFLGHHFNVVVGVLAFLYLLHWAALVHKGNDGGRELSKKAAYEEEYYRFPAGCLEYWMEKDTSGTSNEQPAENHAERRWSVIRKCMIHNRFCERMSGEDWANMTLDQFNAMDLSSIEGLEFGDYGFETGDGFVDVSLVEEVFHSFAPVALTDFKAKDPQHCSKHKCSTQQLACMWISTRRQDNLESKLHRKTQRVSSGYLLWRGRGGTCGNWKCQLSLIGLVAFIYNSASPPCKRTTLLVRLGQASPLVAALPPCLDQFNNRT